VLHTHIRHREARQAHSPAPLLDADQLPALKDEVDAQLFERAP